MKLGILLCPESVWVISFYGDFYTFNHKNTHKTFPSKFFISSMFEFYPFHILFIEDVYFFSVFLNHACQSFVILMVLLKYKLSIFFGSYTVSFFLIHSFQLLSSSISYFIFILLFSFQFKFKATLTDFPMFTFIY